MYLPNTVENTVEGAISTIELFEVELTNVVGKDGFTLIIVDIVFDVIRDNMRM